MLLLLLLFSIATAASNSDSERFKVKIVYVIPADAEPRARYDEILKLMQSVLQEFFMFHLDVTLDFTTTYDIVFVNETVAQIYQYKHPQPIAGYFINQVLNVRYDDAYNRLKQIIMAVMEVDAWCPGGAAGMVVTCGSELRGWLDGPRTLYPYEHEIGHALGLAHTSQTLECLQSKYNVTIDDKTRTFMSRAAPVNPSFLPMADYEKAMLLHEAYAKCLLTLVGRPSPEHYFSLVLPSQTTNAPPTLAPTTPPSPTAKAPTTQSPTLQPTSESASVAISLYSLLLTVMVL